MNCGPAITNLAPSALSHSEAFLQATLDALRAHIAVLDSRGKSLPSIKRGKTLLAPMDWMTAQRG
jgi:hypothetical protein